MWKTVFPQSSDRSKKETFDRIESTKNQAVGICKMFEEKQEEKMMMKTDEIIDTTQQLNEINQKPSEEISSELASTEVETHGSKPSLSDEEVSIRKTEEMPPLTQRTQSITEVMEQEFLISVDEWELYMLGEALKSLMKANVEQMKHVAADEVVQIRQENQRLAYLMQQFEVKRLGKKQALKQMVNRLSLQLDEAQTEQDVHLVLKHLNRLTEIFED